MKQISLRLPDDLHALIKELAEREHRSLHGQVVHILRDYVTPPTAEDISTLTQS